MARKKEPIDKAVDAGIHAAGGAAAGAGVSSVIGGMGLTLAGTGVAIGMLPVATAGAVAGLAIYGIKKVFEEE